MVSEGLCEFFKAAVFKMSEVKYVSQKNKI